MKRSWLVVAVTSCLLGAIRAEATNCYECTPDGCYDHCGPPGDPPPLIDYTVRYAADLQIRFTDVDVPGLAPATPQNLGWSATETVEELCERLGYDSEECYVMHECKVGVTIAGPTAQCPAMAVDIMRNSMERRFDDLLMLAGEQLIDWAGWYEGAMLGFLECYDPMWGGIFYCPM